MESFITQKTIINIKRTIKKLTNNLAMEIRLRLLEHRQADTHMYFPKLDTYRLISCNLLSKIYTGHGTSPVYLHRFAPVETTECEYSLIRTSKNFLTACPLTQVLHLLDITPNND